MAISRHQMARSAGLHLEPVLHDIRERGVLFGIPIRRVERIVDLRLRERFGAAREPLQLLRVAGGWRILVRDRIRPREILPPLLRQRDRYTERQQCDQNQYQMLHEGLQMILNYITTQMRVGFSTAPSGLSPRHRYHAGIRLRTSE